MDAAEIRNAVLAAIESIAPETDVQQLRPDQPLREQVDLDSIDWLNVIGRIETALAVSIPEAHVGRLKTIDAIVAFAASHEVAPRAVPVAVPVDAPPSLSTAQHVINGACVTVRPMGAADFALEADFIRGLSAEARYKRFMTTVSELPKSKMTYLTDVDQRRHVALVATVERDGKPDPVGVARYVVDAAGTSCEFAIALDDDFQHTGLAGILMRMLIDIARSRGLATMEGLVLATNRSMLKFTRQLGFSQQHEPDDYSTVRVALTL